MLGLPWFALVQVLGVLLLANLAVAEEAAPGNDNRTCFWAASARFERFWSLADYERFRAEPSLFPPGRTADVDQQLGMRHIFFVVKASHARADFAIRMETTWMHAAANRIYLVDAFIPGLPSSCQVVMNDGQTTETEDSSPRQSQDAIAISRLMIWINQAKASGYDVGSLPSHTRWIVMLGDDVFVNLARLYYFLALHPADDHPVIFSHVLSDTEVYDFDMPCSSSGIVLSRPALDLLAERASCKECPYVGSDAISLAYCAFYTAIPLVHVPGLHCHPPPIGTADQILTSDLLAHDWIAAGGLSASDLGKRADEIHDDGQLMIHPFEEDFPSSDCKLPSESLWWTAQQLLERMAYCQAASGRQPSSHAQSPPPELVDGSELLPDSIDDYFEARWPGSLAPGLLEEVVLEGEIASDWPNARRALFRQLHREDELDEEVASEGAAQWEESDSQWYFLRSVDTWLHHAEVGRFLKDLEASVLLPQIGSLASPAGSGPALVFAFVQSSLAAPPRAAAGSGDVLDLRGGLLLSRSAAWALVGREGRAATSRAAASAVAPRQLVAAALAALGISLVHTPWLVPDSAALPQTLSGLISEAAVSGSWSIGQVPHQIMLDDLDGKADDRRFFAGLLVENFEDLAKANGGAPCGDVRTGAAASTLASARDWMRFLHDDDEHIKVVRGFQSGRREFRTLHAMYRSEASGELPLHGVNPDTVLVARNCPKEP